MHMLWGNLFLRKTLLGRYVHAIHTCAWIYNYLLMCTNTLLCIETCTVIYAVLNLSRFGRNGKVENLSRSIWGHTRLWRFCHEELVDLQSGNTLTVSGGTWRFTRSHCATWTPWADSPSPEQPHKPDSPSPVQLHEPESPSPEQLHEPESPSPEQPHEPESSFLEQLPPRKIRTLLHKKHHVDREWKVCNNWGRVAGWQHHWCGTVASRTSMG